jgi:hypothetical protein
MILVMENIITLIFLENIPEGKRRLCYRWISSIIPPLSKFVAVLLVFQTLYDAMYRYLVSILYFMAKG